MITYNNLHFIKDGKPWFPVMGEFQYSRQDKRFWADGLAKMKATGVDVVASYAIWIHHEEIEGEFNFDGNCDVKTFLQEAKNAGLLVSFRIGPWVHGEVRNGGFPDWIYNKGCTLRSNDPIYMQAVERYFRALYNECKGFMYDDGGPIFCIQVENEYSQWGRQTETEGDVHINALIKMLKEIGFDVPVYVATGWGAAATGDAVPVWGGYPEAPWEYDDKELPPMGAYVISNNPNDAHIGSDTGTKDIDEDITASKYPYATVELGGGVQVTKVRRPIIDGIDVGAVAFCKLASGAATVGYYVYHGGMNPVGKLTTFQEYRIEEPIISGFCCDLPEINYDFQAPIGSYGTIESRGDELKLVNLFLENFGSKIATMPAYMGKDNVINPENLNGLRYSYRYLNGEGFIFINNFIRRYDLNDVLLKDHVILTDNGSVTFKEISVKNKEYAFYPFNLKLSDTAVLKTATACPYMILNGKDYVFWKNSQDAVYDIDGEFDGTIITLEKNEALSAYKFKLDGAERLFIANCELFERGGKIIASTDKNAEIKVFPPIERDIDGFARERDGIYDKFTAKADFTLENSYEKLGETEDYAEYEIKLLSDFEGATNAFIYIDYDGDSLDLLVDGKKVNDHFYTGVPFKVGLKHYDFAKKLTVKIYPHRDSDFVYMHQKPKTTNGKAMKLNGVSSTLVKEYKI